MAVLGFNHINLRAPRPLLDELRDFYCQVVGLKLGERPPFQSFGYWLYGGGLDLVHLTETRPGEERGTKPTSFDHVAFRCQGPKAVEARLQAAGIPYQRDWVPERGELQLFLQDPAGNGVELNFAAKDG
ncbi:diguanylate cyclase [Gallaecimonas kandeliae]|uniref:VOC family protein n=1 Tax=Gallaecimonas kandeliae TaxID=3029055 RepID=UPI0026486D38|nr:VOC family protein [Gallaecimonas kandeliae]WKE66898.1 diguanylate cyclase [Gallaecimonas kandeliae]